MLYGFSEPVQHLQTAVFPADFARAVSKVLPGTKVACNFFLVLTKICSEIQRFFNMEQVLNCAERG